MKKTYIEPLTSIYDIKLANIIATSSTEPGLDNNAVGIVGEGEEAGRNDNPSSPNIWDQQW